MASITIRNLNDDVKTRQRVRPAVGEAELRYGAAISPTSRRRETLVSDIDIDVVDPWATV